MMHVTSSRFCLFAKYLSLYLHIFTCTYRETHTQAHIYNQHTRGIETTRHRSLVERGGRKALLEILHTQKKMSKKPIFKNLNRNIRASFHQSYQTISYEVIKATSIKTISFFSSVLAFASLLRFETLEDLFSIDFKRALLFVLFSRPAPNHPILRLAHLFRPLLLL